MTKTLKFSNIYLFITLSSLMAFTSVSVDIYLPAIPMMSADLRGDAELSIGAFLVGFSLAQLFWGPLSDKIGRKIPLLLGTVIFTAGSIGCALSGSISEIVVWRIVQAVGASVGPMLARAMIRDLYDKTRGASVLSTLFFVMTLAPILGPIVGGWMIKYFTWHSLFWLLAVFGVGMFIMICFIPETIKERQEGGVRVAFYNYKMLLRNVEYMRYVICITLFYAGLYVYIVGSPSIYIEIFGVSEQEYGYYFAVNIIGIMILSLINRFLVKKFSLDRLLRISLSISLCGAISLLISGLFGLPFYMIVLSIFFILSLNAITMTCSITQALDKVPSIAGSASALIGSFQYASGIVSAPLFSAFKDSGVVAFSVMIFCFTFLAWFTMFVRIKSL